MNTVGRSAFDMLTPRRWDQTLEASNLGSIIHLGNVRIHFKKLDLSWFKQVISVAVTWHQRREDKAAH